jgi:hypothetical protein
MLASRLEAIGVARKLCRTLASAPDPQKQAQTLVSVLLRAEGWGPAAEREITAFASWLATRPPPTDLRLRSQRLIKALET